MRCRRHGLLLRPVVDRRIEPRQDRYRHEAREGNEPRAEAVARFRQCRVAPCDRFEVFGVSSGEFVYRILGCADCERALVMVLEVMPEAAETSCPKEEIRFLLFLNLIRSFNFGNFGRRYESAFRASTTVISYNIICSRKGPIGTRLSNCQIQKIERSRDLRLSDKAV
jgi:hypothetical protein